MKTPVARVVGHLTVTALIGVLVGAIGTVAHRWQFGDAMIPLGIVLALLATVLAGVLARAWAGLLGLLGYGLGWAAVVQVLSLTGPGGDVLVPAQAVGYVWTYGGVVAIAVVAFLPRSWFSEQPVRSRTRDGTRGIDASLASVPGGPRGDGEGPARQTGPEA